VTALVIVGVLLWLFWPSKSKWHPFGGIYKFDKKTGRLTATVQLPTKRARKRKR
jgi:hypothetical protein